MTIASGEGRRIRLLDVDRALARGLNSEEFETARRYAVAHVVRVRRGLHDPNALFAGDGALGLLMLDGLLIRQIAVADRACGELVGPGAVLRPWDDFGKHAPMPFEVSWRVLEDTRIAYLDQRFVAVAVRWPALIETLMARVSERARTLALGLAIHTMRHVHVRLLMLLWHLADQFGRVTPEGVHVPLALSHADLGELIGAARPSVTLAVRRLSEDGLVWRNELERTWMLSLERPDELNDLSRAATHPGV